MQLKAFTASRASVRPARAGVRPVVSVRAAAQPQQEQSEKAVSVNRRELVLNSVNLGAVAVLGSILSIGASPRPGNLGIQDYGGGVKTLALCPSSPNCIATSEEANDPTHYVPPWTYNPQDGRGRKNPASQEQAMDELVAVVERLKPDGFEPKIVRRTPDFLYVEYTSPIMGFIDDVEFWFKPGGNARVEYRSASRIGESDGNINRKRIRAIRQELEKKGWASTGY
eukprot:CAMPEP_0202858814 /NCGR_PEP_ID=MMETSP1391-20130828/1183_1 /ASSEMBLY_ACC=CAM_ASM_000867 /TAXON_ID=1034604 /ORGANISM="Chlamydomonas leiostraca, Strain SAG 11-49" /LENGTH=225 /DNA_ID=CAMNT_0049537775 /DNA_START=20 /DNA_END=697 /DNA_ORIENTATION=+